VLNSGALRAKPSGEIEPEISTLIQEGVQATFE